MENKKLMINVYRFGKYLVGGVLFAAYPLYVLVQILSGDDSMLANTEYDSTLLLVGLVVFTLAAVLTAIYGLVSLIVSKAVFYEDHLVYKTLFKKYKVNYTDIERIQEYRKTKRGLFGSVQYKYTLVCKNKANEAYILDSFEFLGIGKQLDLRLDKLKADNGKAE